MLGRIWIASPNYSSGRSRNQLLVVHTSEGATTFRNLGNFLAQPSAGVSYQVGFDDTSSTQIGEYVKPERKAWAAMNANDWGEHGCCCTPSGASAGWSRDVWLTHSTMLAACAAWLAEEAARYQIPLVKVSAADITAGHKGVCGHGDCSAAGAGGSHFDPGGAFPWDEVLRMAIGAAPPLPTPPPLVEEPTMKVIRRPRDEKVFVTDGITKRHITDSTQELPDLLKLCGQTAWINLADYTVDRMPEILPVDTPESVKVDLENINRAAGQ